MLNQFLNNMKTFYPEKLFLRNIVAFLLFAITSLIWTRFETNEPLGSGIIEAWDFFTFVFAFLMWSFYVGIILTAMLLIFNLFEKLIKQHLSLFFKLVITEIANILTLSIIGVLNIFLMPEWNHIVFFSFMVIIYAFIFLVPLGILRKWLSLGI